MIKDFNVEIKKKTNLVYYIIFCFREEGGGVKEFVTVHTKGFFFFGKFVTREGGGSKKSFFCVT